MSRRRDPLRLSSHWHVDCRIETDLPEDSIIGANFFTNLGFGAVALATILFFGWSVYRTVTLRNQIRDWERRISNSGEAVSEIRKMQREYVAEASKIDRAYAAIRPSLLVSEFLAVAGQTLPPQLTIDVIEWNDNGIIMKGNFRGSILAARGILGAYVAGLRKEEKFNQRFRKIEVTQLFRGKMEDIQNFELTFSLQPLPPL